MNYSQPTLSISMRSDVDIIKGSNQVDDGSKAKQSSGQNGEVIVEIPLD